MRLGPAAPEEDPISRQESTGRPAAGFDRFNLRPELLKAVAEAGYDSPRPIQVEGMPPALAGRDVLGLAQTGTGKTAAFVLPILQRLLSGPKPGPRALVVCPTRELAAQVHAEFVGLGRHARTTSAVVFGGVPIPRQVRNLRDRPDIVVACPGRLLDLLDRGAVRLDGVEVLVLDEADHMFDMGFLPHVRRIIRALPARRQNLMFSATMPAEIRKLADTVLRDPAVVELANARPAETISHALYPLAEADKMGALESLIRGEDFRSAIVFLRTKRRAKRLAEHLSDGGHAAVAMQGNMSQPQRERALAGFRQGRFGILVATDIAARGLDIAGVSHVINFDLPNTPDAYTHRIGRTGRAEQTGTAFTFVTADDADGVRAIEKRLGAPIARRRLAELGPLSQATLTRGGSSAGTSSGSRNGSRSASSTGSRSGSRPGSRSSAPSGSRSSAPSGSRSSSRPAAARSESRQDSGGRAAGRGRGPSTERSRSGSHQSAEPHRARSTNSAATVEKLKALESRKAARTHGQGDARSSVGSRQPAAHTRSKSTGASSSASAQRGQGRAGGGRDASRSGAGRGSGVSGVSRGSGVEVSSQERDRRLNGPGEPARPVRRRRRKGA